MKTEAYNWNKLYEKAEELLTECGVVNGRVEEAQTIILRKPVCYVVVPEKGNREAIDRLTSYNNVRRLYGYNSGGRKWKFAITMETDTGNSYTKRILNTFLGGSYD